VTARIEMNRTGQTSPNGTAAKRVSRAIWQQFAASASLPVFSMDRDGRIVHTAPSVEDLFAVDAGSFAGSRLQDLLDAKGAESLRVHLERVFKKQQACACELRFELPGRGVLWLRLTSQADDGLEEGPLCWSWVENVSAGRQAEQHEATIRRMARAALKSATLDEAGGRILEILCAHEHMDAGYVAMIDEHSGAVFYPAHLDEGMQRPEAHAPHGGLAGHLLSSGQLVWWSELRSGGKSDGPLFDFPRASAPSDLIGIPLKSGRSVIGFFLACRTRPGLVFNQRDVELMIATGSLLEGALSRSKMKEVEAILMSSLSQSPEPVIVTDKNGVIEYVNTAFSDVTGYAADEVAGSPVSILKSGRQDPEVFRAMWKALAEGRPWRGRFINRDKRGQLFEEDAMIWPLKDRAGEIIRYVAIKHVIRESQPPVAGEAIASDSTLFNRVVSAFTHDFRNTLLSIRVNADLLQSKGLSEQRDELGQISDASSQAEALLDNIAALTSPVSLVLRDIDLNQQVNRIQPLAVKLLGPNRRWVAELESRLDTVRVPAGLIEKILTSLLFYAQRVVPAGQAVSVRTFKDKIHEPDRPHFINAPSGDHFQYSVLEISGSGFASGFVRAPSAASMPDPDLEWTSGLPDLLVRILQRHGLLMVRQMAGDLGMIRIYFESSNPLAAPATEINTVVSAPAERASETVLVAEDDPGARRVIRRILESQGYRVLEAENGATAVRTIMFSETKVHLLVADVMMPDFDGKTLADQIMNINPAIKILYVSGFDAEELERQKINLGPSMGLLVKKPFSRDELLVKVRKCLRGS